MMSYNRISVAVIFGFLSVFLWGCSKDKDVEPPAALVPFAAKLSVQKLWVASVGAKNPLLRMALAPAIADGHVYVAAQDGVIRDLKASSGHELWRAATKLALSAGPSVGGGLVLAGSSDGQVVALDERTGVLKWKVRVSGEVLSAPVVSATAVVVRTVDGRVRALTIDTGHELWSNEEQVPRLTLRGTASPVIAGDAVLCGFDNGKIAAYSITNGDVLWDTAISPPRGRTELERMVDIDGHVEVSGHEVFVAGFQGRVAMLGLESGQIWWSHEASSNHGLTVDDQRVFVSLSDSKVQALARKDGTTVWTQEALARRALTAPVLDDSALVVADFEGYLHWLDRDTGALLARIVTKKKSRISNAPVVVDGVVYVQTDAGQLYAFRAHAR
jgi:outer membrane protein assembly factor BamB